MDLIYWDYFVNIENDLINTIKYVEPVKENFNTYSVEFAKIINIACSEIDVLMKEICNKIEGKERFGKKSNNGNINEYKKIIIARFPNIVNSELIIPKGKFLITPFGSWEESKLSWWSDYQQIKHHRNSDYSLANLKNAIFSVGALKILNLYWLRMNNSNKKCLANKNSELFISKYTKDVMFLSDNVDLDDYIEITN